MFNLYVELAMLTVGGVGIFYIFRNDLNIYLFMGLLIFANAMYWAYLREYKIIRHLKEHHPDFYKKYESQIGTKFWKANLKSQLQNLNDEYVDNYLKNLQ